MEFLIFLAGLLLGLLLLGWQQLQWQRRLQKILRSLGSEQASTALPIASQLSSAVTDQLQRCKHQEQQLDILKQLLHVAPIGYLEIDEENQLLWCNAKARSLLEIQTETTRPRLLLELVRSYELDQLIEQTRHAKHPCQNTWTFHPVCPDPTQLSRQPTCPLRGYGFPLLNGHIGVFLESRQEAVTLAQQRDRWTSDVAHELKTPLTSIRLVTETLQSRLEPPLRHWVDRLLHEVIRLSDLVQDLLDLSQMEQRSIACLTFRSINLPELIQSAWGSLEPLARQKHIQLDYSGPESLLIEADESRLLRMLINLLDNAIKYSPPRQCIRVQLQREQVAQNNQSLEQVHLEVIDAGAGFPESALPFVFDRFYRIDASRARLPLVVNPTAASELSSVKDRSGTDLQHKGSSGLGLAIVRQIVETHQGSVTANNHPETGGAWMQVFLPCQRD